MEWQRKSELSADRAGLLATQDPAAAYRALMKLASGGHLDDLDQTSFFEQGAEYDDTDLRDSVMKIQLLEGRSHPMTVSRASELRKWVDSGAYTASSPASTPPATPTTTRRSARPLRRLPPATPSRSATPRTPSAG